MKKFKSSTGSSPEIFVSGKILDFTEFKLQNGLHCILFKDNRNPIVNVSVGYKVGSKDEDQNKRGIAHLFEHLMFQGSDNIKKNEHFKYVMKSGGLCNAFTMHDATIYYEMMPANQLEMAFWLESDRMNSLNLSEENLANQKNVVIEEKKQVNDNAPYGSSFHKIFKNVFAGSNYESAVIGEIDDINSFTLSEAHNFHNTYYSPGNAMLMIAGDFDYDSVEFLINKYFGNIKKDAEIIRKKNLIKDMETDIEAEVADNVQLPVLNICYQIPKSGEKDNYTIDYITEIIANNKSSRLYKTLVYEKQLVKSIKALKYSLEDGGILIIKTMINPGTDIELVKDEIFSALNELGNNGCTDEEFQKIKNQIEFEHTIKYLKIQNISIETIFNYLYFKNSGRINDEIQRYLSISKQDVINAVNKYILNKNKLILTYLGNKS